MALEKVIEEFEKIADPVGWGLSIYKYPSKDSPVAGYMGVGTEFERPKYQLSAQNPLSSSASHGIHNWSEDLEEGIAYILSYMLTHPNFAEKLGISGRVDLWPK